MGLIWQTSIAFSFNLIWINTFYKGWQSMEIHIGKSDWLYHQKKKCTFDMRMTKTTPCVLGNFWIPEVCTSSNHLDHYCCQHEADPSANPGSSSEWCCCLPNPILRASRNFSTEHKCLLLLSAGRTVVMVVNIALVYLPPCWQHEGIPLLNNGSGT